MIKSERHKVYLRAFELIRINDDKYYVNSEGVIQQGICDILYDACRDRESRLQRYDIAKHFPEILRYKPNSKSSSDLWWPIGKKGTKKRYKMLLKAIAKTTENSKGHRKSIYKTFKKLIDKPFKAK